MRIDLDKELLKKDVRELEERNAQVLKELAEAEGTIVELREQVRLLKGEVREAKAENAELHQLTEKLDDRIASLHSDYMGQIAALGGQIAAFGAASEAAVQDSEDRAQRRKWMNPLD